METGATNYASNLVLAWTGSHLQWLTFENASVGGWEALPLQGVDQLRAKLKELELLSPDSVFFFTRTPYFSLAPTRVVSGREDSVQELQMGLSDFPPVIFYSEAFGEEVTLIERDIQGFQMVVEEVWPQAKRCSQALQILETTAIELRMDPKPCSVVIDVGTDRALMAVFAAGKLIWSMTTEDLEGDGILYHVVNAMRRNQLDPAIETSVTLSGQVEPSDALITSLERFFTSVEIRRSPVNWNLEPKTPQHWNALTSFMS